jgi:hypothetical protein
MSNLGFLTLVAVADVLLLRRIIRWYESVLKDEPMGAVE